MIRKRLLKTVISVGIITGTIIVTNASAYAATSSKEEVVYAITDANGDVDTINVVNIFGKGKITDYGSYSEIKMLNSTNPISQKGDMITFESDKDKVYYQGTMTDANLPWNIDIDYSVDGKSTDADAMAGKSGELKIHISINKNEKSQGSFYDNYALQLSMKLDTNNCKNIVADKATIANVGSDKQISYTVLPGKGLDAYISANVTDFEMEAIEINGIKLNLDVDIDDSDIQTKVSEIMDATKKLNNAANEINGGAIRIKDGVGSLSAGSSRLYEATATLNGGIEKLSGVAGSLKAGLTFEAYKAAMKSNGLDIDVLQAQNVGMIQSLKSQIAMSTDPAQIESLSTMVALLEGNNAALGGVGAYLSGIAAQIDIPFSQVYAATSEIMQGAGSLSQGSNELYQAMNSLSAGTNSLYNGTSEFYNKTSDMDKQVKGSIDDMLEPISGGDEKTESFVSDKNTSVDAVQFVIKTTAIMMPDEEATSDETEEKTGFFKKLTDLFR